MDVALGLEGAVKVIKDGEELRHEPLGGGLEYTSPLPLLVPARVLELGLQATQGVQVLVPFLARRLELFGQAGLLPVASWLLGFVIRDRTRVLALLLEAGRVLRGALWFLDRLSPVLFAAQGSLTSSSRRCSDRRLGANEYSRDRPHSPRRSEERRVGKEC